MKSDFYKTIVMCLLASTFYAQQVINTQFKTKTLEVFQTLDKTRVPHGILLDFGMEFTNLQAFNGILTDSSYTTSQTLSDIYKTLLMCRVRQVTAGFIKPQEYATRWYTQRNPGIISLSGQYFKYNRFADNAYPNKLNYSNNKFSDKFIGTVWQNPYEEKQLFAMSTSIGKYKGLSFKAKLPSDLFLTNYPATIQNIQVDFSDGLGFRVVAFNQLINVTYSTPNIYTWKYKVTLTDGQTLLSHSKIEIDVGLNAHQILTDCASCPIVPAQSTSLPATIQQANLSPYSKANINAIESYAGYLGSATVYIRYASGSTITKPLIVAEGFDPGRILNPEQEAGDNNIADFLQSIVRSNSSSLQLEMDSYDVIYVDWSNGTDFIQRNAFVLEEVIKWVNQRKIGTQQNVVLGQSMGGLIARYALKDMENKGLNHDTRLYISHDAPHLGANTPLSVQYSARHLRNIYINTPLPLLGEELVPLIFNFAEGYSAIINLFGGDTSVEPFVTPLQAFSLADVPAARQMQMTWVSNSYITYNLIHDAWQQELLGLGYPVGYPSKPIRNIAISNGSECGISQVDNDNILSYVKDAGRDTFLSNYIGLLDAVYATVLNEPLIVVAALFPGKSYWEIDFKSKYMTILNQNKNIYHGSIKYKKKVFWFIPISITVTENDKSQPSAVLPYDIYSGGQERAPTDQLPLSGITSNSFGFVPTASALDIGRGSALLNDVDFRKSYVGALPPALPKNSPFNNYITHFDPLIPANSNSRHISFSPRNGDWLRSELNPLAGDQYANCSYMCTGAQILGSNTLCGTQSYSAPPGGLYHNWTITQGGNLVSISGFKSASASLTQLPNAQGFVTLSLNMGDLDRCGTINLTKTIWVGKPAFNASRDTDQSEFCDTKHHYVNFIVNTANQGVTEVYFDYNFPGLTYNYIGSNKYQFKFPKSFTGYFPFVVWATNACGTSYYDAEDSNHIGNCTTLGGPYLTGNESEDTVVVETDETEASKIFRIYPNPSFETLNIGLRTTTSDRGSEGVIIANLYDLMGEQKRTVRIVNNIAQIDVHNLLKGIYILKINVDGILETHQVIVN